MSSLRFHFLGLVLGLFLVSVPTVHAAHQTSAVLTSSAAVTNSCVIQSVQSINFGAYNPTSALATQGTGQISLKCTKGDAVAVVPVSGGSSMVGSKASLTYGLYTNAADTTVWGSGPTYAQINFDANLYFAHQITLGASNQSQCTTLAAGALYVWNPTSNGLCWYGWVAPGTSSYYSNGLNVTGNSLYVNGAQVGGTNNGNYIIAPAGTRVGTTGYVYNTLISTGSGTTLSGSSAGASQPLTFTYYANVPGAQDVPAGAYSDTVVVQVSF